jgi:hypothetical protein
MGHSSLLGTEHAAPEPAGRDTAALGPGDSSDSGSDMMGIDDGEQSDPGAPADVALRDDMRHPLLSPDILDAVGQHEGADIGVDHVFTPGQDPQSLSDDEDPDLAFIDQAEAGDPLEDEDEDEDDRDDEPDQAPKRPPRTP